MADLRYTVDVDTRGARNSISGLQSQIQAVSGAIASAFAFRELTNVVSQFEDLRVTLGILYKDVQLGNQAFEQLKAFATQSVLGVDALANSVIKLKAAGLDPTIEQLQLFSNVASVSADRLGTLQAITDLYARTTAGGLGLEDLNRLADRGIPVFTILSEKLGINRLEITKLGQTAEGAQVILQALEEGLEEAFGDASSARIGTLSQGISNLQDAIMNAADAIGQGGFGPALTQAAETLTEFIDKNKELMSAIGKGLGAAIQFVVENLKILGIALGAVFAVSVIRNIVGMVGAVVALAKGFRDAAVAGAVLQGVTGVGLIKLAAGMAGIAGVVAGIQELTGGASEEVEKLNKQLEGLSDSEISIPDGPLTAPSLDIETGNAREQLEKIKEKQNEITRSTINYFAEYKDGVESIKLATEQEAKLLKLTESQANVQRELFAFQQRYYDTIAPLQRRVTELRLKDNEESKVQADEIERQIGLITALYNKEVEGLRTSLELREQNREAEESKLLILQSQRDLQKDLDDLVRQSKNNLEDLNLTPFQKELADVTRQIDDSLIESIQNIKEKWEDGLISGDEYIAQIKLLTAQADLAFEQIKQNAEQQRNIQRSFSYGWKTAFEEYADNAENAAKHAERMFKTTTKGMEDAIVNFAKTGKFEFKDLMATILEELLRSQIRQLIAQTFGGIGGGGTSGGGGILSRFFAGFFADGGTIPSGKFGVVGERGPELVSGPATVTPMSGGSANVTYNISAVDAESFRTMLAREPEFLYAVTEQGKKSLPMGRR